MPTIRLTMHVDTAAGSGDAGDLRDWPASTCAALVDGGAAEWYTPETEPEPVPADEEEVE